MSETAEVPAEPSLEDVFQPADEIPDEPPKVEPEAQEPEKVEAEPDKEGSPSEPEPQSVPIAGLLDERDKRQKLEREVERLQAQLAEKAEPEKRPSVLDDEDGFAQSLMSETQQARLQDKFDLSRDMMSMLKPDFEEKEAVFMQMAAEDASLRQKLLEHPNPARFAYETAEKREELKEMENLDEWRDKERAKLKADIKDELRKEWEAEQAKAAGKRGAMTPSLASRQSKGGSDTNSADDERLEDILGS